MTGTLTIIGAPTRRVEWDTDRPASYEAAKQAYKDALALGAQPFDTKVEQAERIGDVAEMPDTDVTMVPRFAGGQ